MVTRERSRTILMSHSTELLGCCRGIRERASLSRSICR